MSRVEWEVIKNEDEYYRATGPPKMEVGMVNETVLRWLQDRDLRHWEDEELETLAGILTRWGRISPRQAAGLLGSIEPLRCKLPTQGFSGGGDWMAANRTAEK